MRFWTRKKQNNICFERIKKAKNNLSFEVKFKNGGVHNILNEPKNRLKNIKLIEKSIFKKKKNYQEQQRVIRWKEKTCM